MYTLYLVGSRVEDSDSGTSYEDYNDDDDFESDDDSASHPRKTEEVIKLPR